MTKLFLSVIVLCLSALGVSAQKSSTASKPVKPKQIERIEQASKTKQNPKTSESDKSKQNPSRASTKISETVWKILIDALKTEDWEKSASLSLQLLNQVKTDDERKRLAQLRYFYLFALAGKTFRFASVGDPVGEAGAWKDLDKAVSSFIGQEFVLPPRRLLNDCSQVMNYICRVKDNEKALRVTATNSEGTVIHSFEYVLFDQKIDLKEFADKEMFLGGKLKKVNFNNDLTKTWALRLFFENGFIRIVLAE